MPDTQHETSKLTCPAAAVCHPVLSPNDTDIECQITGRLRPEPGSPCTGNYAETCATWRTTKDLERQRVRPSRQRLPHVLGDLPRERIQA